MMQPGLEKILSPVLFGGTGSRSESEEQPDFLPDMFEAGTVNAAGIAGLSAGLDFIGFKGLDEIREHEMKLTAILIDGLLSVPKVMVHGRRTAENRIAVERMRFNETAQAFNTKRMSFPTVLLAGFFGDRFREKPYFKAQEGAAAAPKVTF